VTATLQLTGVVADFFAAVNSFDTDAVVGCFAQDALVNDANREFWGTDSIHRFVAKEITGDRVTAEITEVIEHDGETIVRARFDGEYDKTNLPDELILTTYFTVRNDKIVTLFVIHTQPGY
jgi:limonene-1,2-epoxide hydrolase